MCVWGGGGGGVVVFPKLQFYFGRYTELRSASVVGRKKGNVLFNDALNTVYLRLYDVRHMVKNYSYRKPAAATWAILSD